MNSIIELIASFADIDTRRALGIYRKLPKIDAKFTFRKLPQWSWRYFASEKKLILLCFGEDYEYEVYGNIVRNPSDGSWHAPFGERYSYYLATTRHLIQQYPYGDDMPIFFAGEPYLVA